MSSSLAVVRDPLDDVQIAAPCHAAWDEMRGDDRVRFCGQCSQNVYSSLGLSRDELRELVFEREGRVCLRLYRRADGTLLTADCPAGLAARSFRQAALLVLSVPLLGVWLSMVIGLLVGVTSTLGKRATPEETTLPNTTVLSPQDAVMVRDPNVPTMGEPLDPNTLVAPSD